MSPKNSDDRLNAVVDENKAALGAAELVLDFEPLADVADPQRKNSSSSSPVASFDPR